MAQKDVKSEITGKVWKILLEAGAPVEEEDVIMILESMKMEIPVLSPTKGVLGELLVAEEDDVSEGQVVARVTA